MTTKPTVIAKDWKHLKQLIKDEIAKSGNNCDLNHIDISKVRNMREMFEDSQFNGDISQWNVSKVTNMDSMFYGSQFNGDIRRWDVSSVSDMPFMFHHSQFDEDISRWDVSKVTNMDQMLSQSQFNGDISNWDVSNVEDTYEMFNDSPYASVDTLTQIIDANVIDCRRFHPKLLEALPEDCRNYIRTIAELQEFVGVDSWKEAIAAKDTLVTKKKKTLKI